MGIWVKEGSQNLAQVYLSNQAQNASLYLGLFTNTIADAILNDLTLSSFVEPVATSYARSQVFPGNWIIADELSVYPTIEFEVALEAYGSIVGCFLGTTVNNSGKLLAVHKFAAPVALSFYGDRLEIALRILTT